MGVSKGIEIGYFKVSKLDQFSLLEDRKFLVEIFILVLGVICESQILFRV